MKLLAVIWYYLHHWRPQQIWVRLPLLLCVGGFTPVAIHSIVSNLWGFNFQRTTEITFLLCIPVAVWLMDKIAQRWHDDAEDQ